jgi:hypothetical protein
MNLLLTPLIVVAILALCPQGHADPAPAIHYAPSENLKHIRLFTIVADADGQNMKGLGQSSFRRCCWYCSGFVLVPGTMIAIGAGGRYSIAVEPGGTGWAWGLSGQGQLGDNSFSSKMG